MKIKRTFAIAAATLLVVGLVAVGVTESAGSSSGTTRITIKSATGVTTKKGRSAIDKLLDLIKSTTGVITKKRVIAFFPQKDSSGWVLVGSDDYARTLLKKPEAGDVPPLLGAQLMVNQPSLNREVIIFTDAPDRFSTGDHVRFTVTPDHRMHVEVLSKKKTPNNP